MKDIWVRVITSSIIQFVSIYHILAFMGYWTVCLGINIFHLQFHIMIFDTINATMYTFYAIWLIFYDKPKSRTQKEFFLWMNETHYLCYFKTQIRISKLNAFSLLEFKNTICKPFQPFDLLFCYFNINISK